MAVSYTRQEILQVRPRVPNVPNDISNSRLPENEFLALKELGLLNRRPTRRGCRSGKLVKERRMNQQLQRSLVNVNHNDELIKTEIKVDIDPDSSIITSSSIAIASPSD